MSLPQNPVNACYAGVPDARDGVAYGLGGQRRLFGNGNVARAGRDHGDWPNAVIGLVAPDANHAGRLVPFGISHNVAYVTVRTFVGACDYDVGRPLHQALDYTDNLFSRFAAAKNYFGEADAKGARMVDASEANVFKVEVLDAFDGLVALHFTTFVGLQQSRQFFEIHVCSSEAAF